MKIKYCLVSFLFLTIISSCNVDEVNEVDTELRYYFELFQSEAELRNIEIDITGISLSGYIEDIDSRGVLGQCKSYSNGSKSVVIDDNYWRQADDHEKEYIVFHELGHCALGRDHNNNKSEDGICESIMQSGEDECRSVYNESTREQLIDELFNN